MPAMVLAFSIRARFDNFICDAVDSAVKLRSAGFDIARACTGCSNFVCARSAENMLARFFRKSPASHASRLPQAAVSILFAAALALLSAPAHVVILDLSTMTCKQFIEGGDDTIKMVLTRMDGWYKGDSDEAIIDTDVFVENAKKFGTYCGKNPTMSIVNAAESVLGK
jgi:acid stress chaperone HdeB